MLGQYLGSFVGVLTIESIEYLPGGGSSKMESSPRSTIIQPSKVVDSQSRALSTGLETSRVHDGVEEIVAHGDAKVLE